MAGWHGAITILWLIAAVAGPAYGQPSALPPPGGQDDCAICHLERVAAFEHPDATLLIDPPTDITAGQAQTCLSCHDGSVVDSRRRVWLEDGHQAGVTPPKNMKVPDNLPLVDGKLACRTCHSAHTGGDPETSGMAGFLRVSNETGELCLSCHRQYGKGPESGNHPLGKMPWPVPDVLLAEGARQGPDDRPLTCQTCHTAHGSRQQSLLVVGTRSSQLCLTCHEKIHPAMWEKNAGGHPRNPPLSSDAQRQAVKDLGTSTGPGETLICLSCHNLHHGRAGEKLLADSLADAGLCLRCHPDRKQVLGSKHDLRISAPSEQNRSGKTPAQSGPCGACHGFHQLARQPRPNPPVDPSGMCTTCHQKGQCGQKAGGLVFSHPPEVQCLTCHDPHQTEHGRFLRQGPGETCAECHEDQTDVLAGAHDFGNHPKAKNGRGRTAAQTGKCGFCHGIHDAKRPVLWAATDRAPSGPDDLCIQCHRVGGLAAAKPNTRFRHPTGPKTAAGAKRAAGELPLFNKQGLRDEDGFVACATCHDPHGDPEESPHLLRAEPPASNLCTTCHPDQAALAKGPHDSTVSPRRWPEAARGQQDLCLACHRPHGNDPKRGLWTMPPVATDEPTDGVCLGCHSNADRAGAVPPKAIGCIKCHDPHGGPQGSAHLLRGKKPTVPSSCPRSRSTTRSTNEGK